ncbi:MAG: adenosylcobalamin-dependent ribonucleoside-diphosphate reductase [Chloroflexota bacterium]
MAEASLSQIRKRDGSVVPFDADKIVQAIAKALRATDHDNEQLAADLGERVVRTLEDRYAAGIPGVEDVQDTVEQVLMAQGYPEVAKAYILYRKQRADMRGIKRLIGVEDDLKLGLNAAKVLERRYLLRDEDSHVIETPKQLFQRVAKAVAAAERTFDPNADVQSWEEEFFNVMRGLEFLPNSPTLMNAGTDLGQLSACFVLPVGDSIPDIFEALKGAAIIHQSGGGTGFSFTRLRPQGDLVRSTRGIASGPVSFMKVFDMATGVMKQGGRRRGANMGILRVDHPDISDFILAKKDEGAFANFNLSVAVTDAFMEAVSQGATWPLINPRTRKEARSVKADDVFSMIVNNAWMTGEPGLVFLDEINRHNPTPQLGVIEATNPCGELPLLPYESCNLGSINLARMVADGEVKWDRLRQVVHTAVRFLDDAIQVNAFPLEATKRVTLGNRKIGLGVMGFADALVELNLPYDSEEALDTAERIMQLLSEQAQRASSDLARERGAFPNFEGSLHDGHGAVELRNASLISIAPTGSISIIAGCSSGIEPLFALAYVRNVMEQTRLLEVNPTFERVAHERGFFSQELIREVAQKGTLKNVEGVPDDVRRTFVTDYDIKPEWHVRMQAAFQKYTDNSVSKTVNLPSHALPEDMRKVYTLSHELGCKGITAYRYGSRKQQVLYFGGDIAEQAEPVRYVTVDPEYGGGCPFGTCPF